MNCCYPCSPPPTLPSNPVPTCHWEWTVYLFQTILDSCIQTVSPRTPSILQQAAKQSYYSKERLKQYKEKPCSTEYQKPLANGIHDGLDFTAHQQIPFLPHHLEAPKNNGLLPYPMRLMLPNHPYCI